MYQTQKHKQNNDLVNIFLSCCYNQVTKQVMYSTQLIVEELASRNTTTRNSGYVNIPLLLYGPKKGKWVEINGKAESV